MNEALENIGIEGGLSACTFIDTGSGSGKALMHASFYCQRVIGVENDSLTYLLAAGMLSKFMSPRIVNIQCNFTELPVHLSDLKGNIACFHNGLGWDDTDGEFTRRFVDLNENIKVVALNFLSKKDPMFLGNNFRNGVTWKLFKTVEGAKLSGGNVVMFHVFVKVSSSKSKKRANAQLSDNPIDLACTLLNKGLAHHFLRNEHEQFLDIGEDLMLTVCPYWSNRAKNFISNNESSSHSCGRILRNYNNCCYANSFLALFCNLPMIRDAINDSCKTFPTKTEIYGDGTGEKALLFIMMVYCRSHRWSKLPLLLPYRKDIHFYRDEYFQFGIAMDKVLFCTDGFYGTEDQGEWIRTILLPILNKLDTLKRLKNLIGFSTVCTKNSDCGYNSTVEDHESEVFYVPVGDNGHDIGTVSMQSILTSYVKPEDLTNNFTSHFLHSTDERNGSVLKNQSYKVVMAENPRCAVNDVVYDKTTKELATIKSKTNKTVHMILHVKFKKNYVVQSLLIFVHHIYN